MLRKLGVAAVIDELLPPHPATILSCGRGVEALVLAILDGSHAFYKVGQRLEERGMLPLLQAGLQRESLNDYQCFYGQEALLRAVGAHALTRRDCSRMSSTHRRRGS